MSSSGGSEEDDLLALRVRPAATRLPVALPYKPEQVIERSSKKGFDLGKSGMQETDVNLGHIVDIIHDWPNWDVWPFKVAIPTVGAAAAATGFFLNSTFRNALYLEHFSRASSYIAVTAFPAFSSSLIHALMISGNILQQKNPGCPVCLQVQSAVIQLLFGVGAPILSAPLLNYSTAAALKHLHFPDLKRHPDEVFAYTKSVFKPVMGRLGVIAAAQVILAMGLTSFQQNCFYTTVLPVLQGKKTFATLDSGTTESIDQRKLEP